MTIDEAIAVLELHNQWRKGAEIEMQPPFKIGMAIDLVVCKLKNLRKPPVGDLTAVIGRSLALMKIKKGSALPGATLAKLPFKSKIMIKEYKAHLVSLDITPPDNPSPVKLSDRKVKLGFLCPDGTNQRLEFRMNELPLGEMEIIRRHHGNKTFKLTISVE